MRALTFGGAVVGLALSGCTTPVAAPASGPQSISYETGPCFGACPIYRVTVNRDGMGLFEGRRYAAVTGERRFTVTAHQFRAFERHLASLRPESGERRYSGEACDMMATDMPSADVTWRGSDGSEQRLHFYYGCDMERNQALAERLRTAPDLLPVADLIGRR